MLELRGARQAFIVYDTDDGEPVMRFGDRRDADAFVAEQRIAELYATLQRWSRDVVPAAH